MRQVNPIIIYTIVHFSLSCSFLLFSSTTPFLRYLIEFNILFICIMIYKNLTIAKCSFLSSFITKIKNLLK